MQKGKQNADFLQMKKTKTPQRLSMGTVGTLCTKLSAREGNQQQRAQESFVLDGEEKALAVSNEGQVRGKIKT